MSQHPVWGGMGDADYIFNGGAAVILKFEEPKQITQQEGEKEIPVSVLKTAPSKIWRRTASDVSILKTGCPRNDDDEARLSKSFVCKFQTSLVYHHRVKICGHCGQLSRVFETPSKSALQIDVWNKAHQILEKGYGKTPCCKDRQ